VSEISDEFTAYQALLEFVRNNPENVELKEDLAKAKRAMDIAWMEEAMK
jgi:hypothetical protein